MGAKQHVVRLTVPEINHILGTIHADEVEGWYLSSKEQYWKRSFRIVNKLERALYGGSAKDNTQQAK